MAAKNKVTVSVQPAPPRPSTAERRAAHSEMLSTKQAQLKAEAAERRRNRALDAADPPAPRAKRPRPR